MADRRTIAQRVAQRFGPAGLHWSLAEADDGEAALCDLVMMTPAYKVRQTLGIVEIGTHQGVSAAILSQFGFVRTYDPVDWPLRAEILRFLDVEHAVEFTLIPTCCEGREFAPATRTRAIAEANAWIAAHLREQVFDVAVIDGNHDYASVAANFDAVRHCGAVIFHDYSDNGFHRERTVRFVDGIRAGRVLRHPPFALWLEEGAP